jgi:hypothetical protein
MTFENLYMVGGDVTNSVIEGTTSPPSINITFTRCVFENARTSAGVGITGTAVAMNWTFDSCVFFQFEATTSVNITMPTVTGADYDTNIVFKNCLFFGGHNVNTINVTTSGALANKPGGVDLLNCTILGGNVAFRVGASCSTSIPCTAYNCLIISSTAVSGAAASVITEDYNVLYGSNTPRVNTSTGANSQAAGTAGVHPYALLLEVGQARLWGFQPRPMFSPTIGSPILGFGNQAGTPATDFAGAPRPSGPGITWANALPSLGYTERGNTATKETTTIRTGSNALKILGPGTQDFAVPVNAASTTVTVYARYDGTYAGTLPQMIVRNGEEAGVTTATATCVGAANTWEQLSLNFTPSSAGIVTIRLQSNSTAGGGAAFFDDFAVA